MKKWICVLLVLTLALTAGCASKGADPEVPFSSLTSCQEFRASIKLM